MSSIEPIDSRLGPVERMRPTTRRDRREPEQQPKDEPREREPDEREQPPAGGGLVDVRV